GCHAADNGAMGIRAVLLADFGASSLVECTAEDNVNEGILTGARGIVTACTASGNGMGIVTGIRALVSNCSAHENANDGIVVGGASSVLSCSATGNGTGTGGS